MSLDLNVSSCNIEGMPDQALNIIDRVTGALVGVIRRVEL